MDCTNETTQQSRYIKARTAKKHSIPLCLILCFLSVWCISPPLFINGAVRYISLFAMLAGLVYTAFCMKKVDFYSAVLLFYVAYSCFAGVNLQGSDYILQNVQLFILLGIAYMAYQNQNKEAYIKSKAFLWVVLCIYPVWMFLTIQTYAVVPNISRALAGNDRADTIYWSLRGVGGYGMVYSIVIMIPILIYILKNIRFRNKFQTALVWVNLILSVALILMAGYSLALLISVIGIFFILLYKQRGLDSFLKVLLAVIALLIVYILFRNDFLNWIVDITKGSMYERKVVDIINSMMENQSTGTLEARMVRYQLSWETFIEHPIFGCFIQGSNDVGGHSYFLDMFARFGLLGGLSFLYLVIAPLVKMFRSNRNPSMYLTAIVQVLVLGFTNNFSAAMAPILYLLPLAVDQYCGLFGNETGGCQNEKPV